jgi:ABC-type dipeptide/oligopeptide/nickel transport system permease subunit
VSGQRKQFLVSLLFQLLLGYINGILLAKFGLLIDRTLSIFLKVRLNVLASVIMLPLISFCLEGVKEKKEAVQFLPMLIPMNC